MAVLQERRSGRTYCRTDPSPARSPRRSPLPRTRPVTAHQPPLTKRKTRRSAPVRPLTRPSAKNLGKGSAERVAVPTGPPHVEMQRRLKLPTDRVVTRVMSTARLAFESLGGRSLSAPVRSGLVRSGLGPVRAAADGSSAPSLGDVSTSPASREAASPGDRRASDATIESGDLGIAPGTEVWFR